MNTKFSIGILAAAFGLSVVACGGSDKANTIAQNETPGAGGGATAQSAAGGSGEYLLPSTIGCGTAFADFGGTAPTVDTGFADSSVTDAELNDTFVRFGQVSTAGWSVFVDKDQFELVMAGGGNFGVIRIPTSDALSPVGTTSKSVTVDVDARYGGNSTVRDNNVICGLTYPSGS